jgi:hypothetical protein
MSSSSALALIIGRRRSEHTGRHVKGKEEGAWQRRRQNFTMKTTLRTVLLGSFFAAVTYAAWWDNETNMGEEPTAGKLTFKPSVG